MCSEKIKYKQMKKISILGTGWLGKPLAVSLLNKGYSVKGSTTKEDRLSEIDSLGVESHLVNIEGYDEFDSFLQSDILIIAITSKDIVAYERLILQIQKSTIQKVIFISSTSVYPDTNSVVTEDTKTIKKPLTAIEQLFRKNKYFKTNILRFAGLFGRNRHPGNWFKRGGVIPQPEGYVNMIHQEDGIKIIQEIITQNCWNITLNACSNHHPTRREFYTNAKASLGFDEPIFEETDQPLYKIISSKQLQAVLDYEFIHDDLLSI